MHNNNIVPNYFVCGSQSAGCCLFHLHPLYVPQSTSGRGGGGGGGSGGLQKGYTPEMFVFAIPDINPIRSLPRRHS